MEIETTSRQDAIATAPDIIKTDDSLDDFLVEELEIRLEMQGGCVFRCVESDWQGNCTIGQWICP